MTGRGKGDKRDERASSGASPTSQPTAPPGYEAAAETRVDMVSPYAHPLGAKAPRFDLRQVVARHAIPIIAVSCLTLAGTIAAVLLKRRRRDRWDARIDRLRRTFADAANGAG